MMIDAMKHCDDNNYSSILFLFSYYYWVYAILEVYHTEAINQFYVSLYISPIGKP